MVLGGAVGGQGVKRRQRRSGGEPCWIAGGDRDVSGRDVAWWPGWWSGGDGKRERKEGEKMGMMESRVGEGF